MPIQPYDVLMAAARGRGAIRRGDLAEAERWFKLAERAAKIAQRLHEIARAEAVIKAHQNSPRNYARRA